MGIKQYGEAYNFRYSPCEWALWLGKGVEYATPPIIRTTRVWVTKTGRLIVICPEAVWYDYLTGQRISLLKQCPDTVFPQINNPRSIQTNPEFWEKKQKPINYYVGTV